MKKILLLSAILVSLCSAIFVINGKYEVITSGYKIPERGKGKFAMNDKVPPLNFTLNNLYQTIDNVSFDGNNITILSKAQRLGLITMGSVAQIGSGNTYSPVVMVDNFDIENSLSKHESFPINLADLLNKTAPYSIMDAVSLGSVIGTNTDDLALTDIKAKYPKAFLPIVQSSTSSTDTLMVSYYFGSYAITSYKYSKGLDESKQLETYQTKNAVTQERVDFGGAEYKLFPWGIDFYNEKGNTVTVPVGCNRKDLKNQFYKEFAYVTHSATGKIINQPILKFDFTKDHEYISLVENAQTGEKQLVAILGNKMYMGKQNDPEPNKFTLVVLNPDGSLKLKKDFQYGLKGREFMPAFAFMNGDITYVVSRNKLTSTLETFVFDAAGEFTIMKQPSADIYARTYGNRNGAMSFLAGSQKYKPFATKKLASGNVVLLTNDEFDETIPNPNAKPGDMNQTFKINRYKNVIAFEFTPTGECVGQFVQFKEFQHTKTPTYIEEIIVKNDKIIILTLDKDKSIINPLLSALHNDQMLEKGCKPLCKPAVIEFNFTDKSLSISKADPMFITLYGTQSYFLLNDNAGIAYYGYVTGKPSNECDFQVNVIKF